MSHCTECGGRLPGDAKFCPSCGAAVATSATVEPSGESGDATSELAAWDTDPADTEEPLPTEGIETGPRTARKWPRWAIAALAVIVGLILIASLAADREPVDVDAPVADADAAATPAPATPTAPRAPAPAREQLPSFELTGSGQRATDSFEIAGGVTIFRMTHRGSSNFAVSLKDASTGSDVELLVNTIGSFDGSKLAGVPAGTYLFDVSADGPWTVTIEQPRPSGAEGVPQTLAGDGQSAAGPIELGVGLARFELTHSGDGNFAVWLIDDSGDNVALLANEIGAFEGSKAESVSAGIYWLDVTANGSWSIAISQ